jgi:DNA-binding transcriptional ArsR family regulator
VPAVATWCAVAELFAQRLSSVPPGAALVEHAGDARPPRATRFDRACATFDECLNRRASNMKDTFSALSDPTRRQILRLLRQGSRTAGEIAEEFELSKPTLSHHFRVLEAAGLVRSEKRGTSVVFTLQSNVLEDAAAELLELAGQAAPRRKKVRS